MRTFPYMPGVPAMGHVHRGSWHPGRMEGCRKCEPYKDASGAVPRKPGTSRAERVSRRARDAE